MLRQHSTGDTPLVDFAPPTSALIEVPDFGPNPTGLGMHLYVPRHVSPNPAVVVVVHNCTGSGPRFFSETRFASLADRYGFIAVYPSSTREGHCYDVSSPGALTHDGDSDPVGIVSMVHYTLRYRSADPGRVYVTGLSSGAMMTNVLLATYPDVFAAGSSMSGVPFGAFATDDGSMWNSASADGKTIRPPQQWGDLVRGAYPGYRGPRPRVQLWHGTADAVLRYPNHAEAVKQWTNVLHARQARVEHPRAGWTHTVYTGRSGRPEVDAYSIEGEDHDLGFHCPEWARYAVEFFGLAAG